MNLDNVAIIEAIKNGSEKIVFMVYDEYRNDFRQFVKKKYNADNDLIDDLFQDAMISLIRQIHNGKLNKLNSSIKTYLFSIGRNLLFDYYNKEKKKTIALKEIHLEGISTSDHFIDDRIDYVKNELAKLGDRCKEILMLFYAQRMNMSQIATELGFKNADVAKKTKYECMKRLEKNVLDSINSNTNGTRRTY